jgi:penicillin-binding protein 1A
LVKTAFLQSERRGLRGLRRKLREAILAARLEREISKDVVIEDYLNTVYFGDVDGTTIVGIQQAANFYFAKNAKELNLYECATLVGSLASPNTRNFRAHPEAAHRYAGKVVAKAVAHNFVSQREADSSLRARSKPGRAEFAEADGRHFLSALADEAFRLNLANNGGEVRLVVTIDPRQQLLGESLVCRMIKSGGSAGFQGALVAMTPLGEIRALVGGCDFATSSFNRATQAKRQPGSAFKPFVYAAAMQAGLSAATVRNDFPVSIDGWQPENSDRRYRGPISLETAFAQSINTVAVRLAHEVSMTEVIKVGHALGITSHIRPNLTSALGTSEVNLLELTRAFAPFVNDGRRVEAHSVLVAISSGRFIFQAPTGGGPVVLNRRVHTEMRRLLGAVVKVGTGRRAGPAAVGGKTGTSQNSRDGWFIGWRRGDSLLTGIWTGNDANDSIPGLSGGGLPAELWRQFSSAIPHDANTTMIPRVPQKPMDTVSSGPPADLMPGCRRFPNLC